MIYTEIILEILHFVNPEDIKTFRSCSKYTRQFYTIHKNCIGVRKLKALNLKPSSKKNNFEIFLSVAGKNVSLKSCVSSDDTILLEYLHENYVETLEVATLEYAILSNKIKSIKYLVEYGYIIPEDLLKRNMLLFCSHDVLDYIFKNSNIKVSESQITLYYIIGHMNMVTYFLSRRYPLTGEMIDAASNNCHYDILEYLYYNNFVTVT